MVNTSGADIEARFKPSRHSVRSEENLRLRGFERVSKRGETEGSMKRLFWVRLVAFSPSPDNRSSATMLLSRSLEEEIYF